MTNSPGTVSKILWHFTGGPRWDKEMNRQEQELKPTNEAFEILIKIMRSKRLLVGNFKEVIHTFKLYFEKLGPGSIYVDPTRRIPEVVYSLPVTCLADIPIMHLGYHSDRYGKVAIGFRREKTIRAGFNPVLYQLVGSEHLDNIQYMLACIDGIDCSRQAEKKRFPGGDVNPPEFRGHRRDENGNWVQCEDSLERGIKELKQYSTNFLAFIKSFRSQEFDKIYTEREWRSTKEFAFDYADVAMIVVPHQGGYFDQLIAECENLVLPRSIPVVPWEDLIEH